ncbi:hypothetical protein pb186bvf_020829 [Paramecium bursaria]
MDIVRLFRQPLINLKNKEGNTPLHVAAMNERQVFINLLLENKQELGLDYNSKELAEQEKAVERKEQRKNEVKQQIKLQEENEKLKKIQFETKDQRLKEQEIVAPDKQGEKKDIQIINYFQKNYQIITIKRQIKSNFNNLVAKNINYQSTLGIFQGNRVKFTNFSRINIESGDIIVQTDQEIQLNWTHAIPNYCYSAPLVANPIVIGCEMPKESERNIQQEQVHRSKKIKKLKITMKDPKRLKKKQLVKKMKERKIKMNMNNFILKNKVIKNTKIRIKETNIFLFDELPNYEQTKNYQNIQKNQQEFQKGSKKKIGKFMNLKMKHNQEAQLFNPSCSGSILLCLSEGCLNIQHQYYKRKHLLKMKKKKNKKRLLELLISTRTLMKKRKKIQEKKEEEKSEEEEKSGEGDKTQGEEQDPQNNGDNQDNKSSKSSKNKLPHDIKEGIPFLNLTGKFGNIYVNIINQSVIVDEEQTVVFGSAYKQNINFSLPSIKKIYDPSFIFGIGQKQSQSDNYQQWQLTFNPTSAFIDYLFIMITKKLRNCAEKLYRHLFQEKDSQQDSDDVEQILSIDFKTLYEKFCYLNGFLEQQLDDNANKEYLTNYGFCINEHLGAQTECNVRVLFDKMVKLTEVPQNKTSYQLFIEKCCRLNNFEQDSLTLKNIQ